MTDSQKKIIVLDSSNFDSFLKENNWAIIDFWAPWCGPCLRMNPILEDWLQEKERAISIGKVNIDASQEIATGYGILSIPTFILFHQGEEKERKVGSLTKVALHEWVKSNGVV